ncbi:uncharacterized protein [Drosophila takahashii]|uniref:uncharacterized protein isoform X2 n=1 Tax=Drosophila takahashii TaxID=29030 RepID=UPI003898E10E
MKMMTEAQMEEKKVKFSVTMGRNEAKNACIDLVTKQKLPLAVFDSTGFKTLTNQIFCGLNMPAVTSRNIMGLVEERCNRGILGVNVQFIENGKIVIKTLGLIELTKSHTSQNLCSEVQSIMDDFCIKKEQIYSITTDIGRNMVKAVDLLNKWEIDDDESPDELQEEELTQHLNIHSIVSIKCAAHTLQLAIKDFFDRLGSVPFIDKARNIVKLLRTPSFSYLIEEEALSKPVLDVPTRWSSTYLMLQRLQTFEHFCERHLKSSVKLSATEWSELENLTKALEPAYLATQKLQSSQLFLGDFYKLWLELKLTVAASQLTFCRDLYQCIQKREDGIIEDKMILSSIYLDPRIRRVLLKNPTSVMLARANLKQLLLQILSLKRTKSTSEGAISSLALTSSPASTSSLDLTTSLTSTTSLATTSTIASTLTNESPNNSSSSLLLDEFLNGIEAASGEEEEFNQNEVVQKGFAEIESYFPKPISLDTDIMKFWEENKLRYPILYQLATVVHAVPATQVSVERSFSALKMMLTDNRCNIKSSSLAMLLFVKLNNN